MLPFASTHIFVHGFFWVFFFLFSTLCILKVNRNFAFDQRTQLSAETETWTCLFHKTRAHKGSCLCPGRRESNIFEAYILKHSRATEKEGLREKIPNLLVVHSSNGRSGCIWAGLKPGASSFVPTWVQERKHLGCPPLPSGYQGAGLEWTGTRRGWLQGRRLTCHTPQCQPQNRYIIFIYKLLSF